MKPLKQIKSFVCRNSKPTNLQLQIHANSWLRYGLDVTPTSTLDLTAIFGNHNPCVVEIGFGNGSSLLQMARTNPGLNFIGFEVFTAGIYNVCNIAAQENLGNIRVICGDALMVLEQNFPANSITRLQLFFPDPWPKKRHNKRRIVRHNFLNLIATKLVAGGMVHFATDWEPYALEMLQTLEAHPQFVNAYVDSDSMHGENHSLFEKKYSLDNKNISHNDKNISHNDKNYIIDDKFVDNSRLNLRPVTKFEQRGLKLGHKIFDLVYQMCYPGP
jgi:tRNA (guanine-N7-)-methyltransferase